ncbi:hypothetical protein K402DRAFT_417704 [Aulographum hederae CBS 113979]|uniref:Uncharacterized protein n=1 Tax=Aulographum hederae CBS 113979 TaxID=1176131 RepID=A0A6G1HB42_9PEZI|nr:hypothetical protein K402DRAFT_417704 [Aulographum hederae CBS 113979]
MDEPSTPTTPNFSRNPMTPNERPMPADIQIVLTAGVYSHYGVLDSAFPYKTLVYFSPYARIQLQETSNFSTTSSGHMIPSFFLDGNEVSEPACKFVFSHLRRCGARGQMQPMHPSLDFSFSEVLDVYKVAQYLHLPEDQGFQLSMRQRLVFLIDNFIRIDDVMAVFEKIDDGDSIVHHLIYAFWNKYPENMFNQNDFARIDDFIRNTSKQHLRRAWLKAQIEYTEKVRLREEAVETATLVEHKRRSDGMEEAGWQNGGAVAAANVANEKKKTVRKKQSILRRMRSKVFGDV